MVGKDKGPSPTPATPPTTPDSKTAFWRPGRCWSTTEKLGWQDGLWFGQEEGEESLGLGEDVTESIRWAFRRSPFWGWWTFFRWNQWPSGDLGVFISKRLPKAWVESLGYNIKFPGIESNPWKRKLDWTLLPQENGFYSRKIYLV